MKTLVVNFENDVALEGVPFIKERLPFLEITGLLARNVHPKVYDFFPKLPIFEKKIELKELLELHSECVIENDLIQFLTPYEEQIHYHINRYFETGLAYDYSMLKYKFILYVLEIFKEAANTELVLFGVTPHDPVSYLVYLTANFRGVKVLMIDKSDWLNGYVLYEKIGERASTVLNSPVKRDKEEANADINIIQSSLKSLIKDEPHYMRKQRKQFGSLYKKLWTSIIVKRRLSIAGLLRYREKQKEKETYSRLVSIKNEQDLISQKDKLIFFPLHYQPELTTSPDGGIYSQQWLAVKHLAEKLPLGFKVLIKEHPTQFLLNSKRVRSQSFYQGILSISPNIEFVGLNVGSEKVLNHSSGVITITGTIGLEALLSGKPVLYFGDAIFGGIMGAYNAHQIQHFLDHILQSKSLKQEDILTDFNRFGKSVFFTGIDPNLTHPASHFKALEILIREYFNLINS